MLLVPDLCKPAPYFEGTAVVNGVFQSISLDDFKDQYVVLLFYPMDFSYVCPTEVIAFSDRIAEFQKINTAVIACSTDSQYAHLAWMNTPRNERGVQGIQIPLLSDKSGAVAWTYGVLNKERGVPFRALFIIDDIGSLRQITINDQPVGRSVDEVLRIVQAFQYSAKFGEVCPAGWIPGKPTIKPDPKESLEYFNKQ